MLFYFFFYYIFGSNIAIIYYYSWFRETAAKNTFSKKIGSQVIKFLKTAVPTPVLKYT